VSTSSAVAAAKIVRSTASAERSAIDAMCDVYDARPNLARRVQLVRVSAGAGLESWRVSDPNIANASAVALEFADVFGRDGRIVYAIDNRTDAGGTHEYCFSSGRLARASASVVDTTTDESKTRKLYFDAMGFMFADTGLVTRDIDKRRNDLVRTKTESVPIAVYRTPASLPFFAAYRAAVAGKLAPLR
jgi:hypothetical protein